MTKLLSNKGVPFAGQLHGLDQLPALFNENWLKDVFYGLDKWEKAFDLQNVHYPYDISYIKDELNKPTEYRLDIALAGVGKDNIKLSVADDHLLIDVERPPFSKGDNSIPLRNGISYRQAKLKFQLGKNVDVDKIKSSYKDGLLSVTLPIFKSETKNISIRVD